MNQASTHGQKTDRIETNELFRLIYFRGMLSVNLHMTDTLFSNESFFSGGRDGGVGGYKNVKKDRFRFLKGHICFDNQQERTQLWEIDGFTAVREILEIFIGICFIFIRISLHHRNIFDETSYPMTHQTAFFQYNPNKPHCYGLLLKSLNDEIFPYTYKTVRYAAKPKAGDGLYYLKATIEYIKCYSNQNRS